MRALTILALLTACTADPEPETLTEIAECGPNPAADEPGFAVTAGTYPGQGNPLGVCIAEPQYADRDAWVQELRDWAICVELADCRARGACQ